MRLLPPAKINLHLRVGPRRADGFHPLLSWMATVGLFDNLVLERQEPAAEGTRRGTGAGSGTDAGAAIDDGVRAASVALVCDLPGLPCDERNLVVRIALAFGDAVRAGKGAATNYGRQGDKPDSLRAAGRQTTGTKVRATLHKRIPVGAGLGGGSSDAARTLLALNQLWEAGWAADDLSAFAARFGSDLSFFVYGPSSVCRGRGEVVVPVATPTPKWALLVLPKLSMPTPDVYRKFDQLGLGRESDINDEPNWESWTRLSSLQLLPRLVNDLEPPAFAIAPELGALRERVEEILGRPVRMSGSGSSLFTLFDTESEAKAASARIEAETGEVAPAVELSPRIEDDLNEAFAIR